MNSVTEMCDPGDCEICDTCTKTEGCIWTAPKQREKLFHCQKCGAYVNADGWLSGTCLQCAGNNDTI